MSSSRAGEKREAVTGVIGHVLKEGHGMFCRARASGRVGRGAAHGVVVGAVEQRVIVGALHAVRVGGQQGSVREAGLDKLRARADVRVRPVVVPLARLDRLQEGA